MRKDLIRLPRNVRFEVMLSSLFSAVAEKRLFAYPIEYLK